MAIVPLAKFTLYGSADDKTLVLDGLQALGCMHLISLAASRDDDALRRHHSPDAAEALKYLRASKDQRRNLREDNEFDFDRVVSEALLNQERQEDLRAERDELKQSVETLKPWGDFLLPSEDELGGLQFWFYVFPHHRLSLLENAAEPWHVVARDHRVAYVAVLGPEEPQDIPIPPIQLDPRPLSQLESRLEAVETGLEELHWERVRLTRWIHLLSRTMGLAEDRADREQARRQTLDASAMFAVQGWAPQAKREILTSFAREHGLAITIENATAKDSPPTLLANRGLATGGEDAVTFYTTPAYHSWDPSGIVFLSFSLFFAMIMADAGYAMLLAVFAISFWRRLGASASLLRMRRLFTSIVVFSIAYGMAVGSYFGMAPPADSLLARLHFIDASNSTVMMQFSITIGVLHLVIANWAIAWSRRWSSVMLSSIGWSVALLGGLSYGFGTTGSEPNATLTEYGSWALGTGFVLILLFSSELSPLTLSVKQHAKRLLDGVLSLTKITRAFGDVLSYLRLFALGLASAQLAATFNGLISDAGSSVGVSGLLTIMAVAFGHGLNFILAIMSGVVHGLRLNCIEFFGWSLADEGYPFQPFKKRYT